MCRVFLLHREQDFCNFCCKPSKIKFCIEEVSVGEIYNTLLDSNEGYLSPHTSQTIYFSKTNENNMSDKEAPVGEVVEFESGIEPLSITFINIRRRGVPYSRYIFSKLAKTNTLMRKILFFSKILRKQDGQEYLSIKMFVMPISSNILCHILHHYDHNLLLFNFVIFMTVLINVIWTIAVVAVSTYDFQQS